MVPPEQPTHSRDKELRITGSADQISSARKLVLRSLATREGDSPDFSSELVATAHKVFVPNELVGLLIGTGGSTVRRLEEQVFIIIIFSEREEKRKHLINS